MFTSIIFRKTAFDETAISAALKRVEEEFPIPHPHPRESFTKVDVNEEVFAVFYEIGGYSSRTKCFVIATEFLEIDYFLNMIEDATKERLKEYCFYSIFYCDMDGYETSYKYCNSGFEYRQIMDGNCIRHFTDEYGKTGTIEKKMITNNEREKEEDYGLFSADGLLKELDVDIQDLIEAYHRLNSDGIVLWSYEESKC